MDVLAELLHRLSQAVVAGFQMARDAALGPLLLRSERRGPRREDHENEPRQSAGSLYSPHRGRP
jgi:hypothetical protein